MKMEFDQDQHLEIFHLCNPETYVNGSLWAKPIGHLTFPRGLLLFSKNYNSKNSGSYLVLWQVIFQELQFPETQEVNWSLSKWSLQINFGCNTHCPPCLPNQTKQSKSSL